MIRKFIMSDIVPPSSEPELKLATWVGAPTISVIALVLSACALGAALWMYLHDGTSAPLIGAIGLMLGKGGTVVDFWLGSSHGSQKKDGIIANQNQILASTVLSSQTTSGSSLPN